MEETVPQISVVICTRNRGASIVQTLESVFANEHPSFEVIVVDQSTNQETFDAVAPYFRDTRFRYIRSDTVGLGVCRNVGLKAARGDIVAYTDDDCTVPIHWLQGVCETIKANPRIAMVFCNVEPAPFNPSDGYIPAYTIPKDRIIHSMRDLLFWELGIGAGMGFRRELIISIGGFDNCLGAGSRFYAGEDHDIAIRILLNNWWIYESSTVTVTHFGFRSWCEGKTHSKHSLFSLGATYIKPIKCRRWKAGILFVSVPLLRGWWEPFSNILHGKKPRGFGRIVYFIQGIMQGLKTQMDCNLVLYEPDKTIGLLKIELSNKQDVGT